MVKNVPHHVPHHFPAECRVVLETLKQVYWHDALAREQGLTPAARLAFHQARSGPLMAQLECAYCVLRDVARLCVLRDVARLSRIFFDGAPGGMEPAATPNRAYRDA